MYIYVCVIYKLCSLSTCIDKSYVGGNSLTMLLIMAGSGAVIGLTNIRDRHDLIPLIGWEDSDVSFAAKLPESDSVNVCELCS